MNSASKTVFFIVLGALLCVGCKKGDASPTAAASASVEPAPPQLASVSGRCRVTTPGTPYDMVYFYPDKNELALRLSMGAAAFPLTIVSRTPTSIDFVIRGFADPDNAVVAKSEAGKLTVSRESWSLTLENNSGAECTPDAFDSTFKPVVEIGVRAGSWSTKDKGMTVVFSSDSQTYTMSSPRGHEILRYYRVLDKTEGGIVLAVGNTALSSAEASPRRIVTLTTVGEKLNYTMDGVSLMLSYDGPAPGANIRAVAQ